VKMFKKAQGMSINTIIIAIIVLVVLVVLVMIFTGYFGGWTRNVATCQSQGGICDSTGLTRTSGVCQSNLASAGEGKTESLSGRCDPSVGYAADAVCCGPGSTAVSR
jgi:hypothetical protein